MIRYAVFLLAFVPLPAYGLDVQTVQQCFDRDLQKVLTQPDAAAQVIDFTSLGRSAVGRNWENLDETRRTKAVSVATKLTLRQIAANTASFIGTQAQVRSTTLAARGTHYIATGKLNGGDLTQAEFTVNLRGDCRIISIKIETSIWSASMWTWLKRQAEMQEFQ